MFFVRHKVKSKESVKEGSKTLPGGKGKEERDERSMMRTHVFGPDLQ